MISPEKLMIELQQTNSEVEMIEKAVMEKFNTVIEIRNLNIKQEWQPSEWAQVTREWVEDLTTKKLNSQACVDYLSLNADTEYGNLTQVANDIETEIDRLGPSIEKYNEMINNRLQAFEMGKLPDLCLLIARDYNEYGSYLVKKNKVEEAIECYLTSIEYYHEYITLLKEKDKLYYDTHYRIGQTYHRMGDINKIDLEMREDCYFMGTIYNEISTSYDGEDSKYVYFAPYYTGMLNHKVSIIRNNKDDRYVYLEKARLYYKKAIEFNPVKKDKKYLYKSVIVMNEKLIEYINNIDIMPSLQPIQYYSLEKKKYEEIISKLLESN